MPSAANCPTSKSTSISSASASRPACAPSSRSCASAWPDPWSETGLPRAGLSKPHQAACRSSPLRQAALLFPPRRRLGRRRGSARRSRRRQTQARRLCHSGGGTRGVRRSEVRRSEVGGQRSEVRGRRSEVGGQRSEVGVRNSGNTDAPSTDAPTHSPFPPLPPPSPSPLSAFPHRRTYAPTHRRTPSSPSPLSAFPHRRTDAVAGGLEVGQNGRCEWPRRAGLSACVGPGGG